MAVLYGIGIGPGDPGLVTLAAARALAAADVVFAPTARIKDGSLAASIAIGAGADAAKMVELRFPMSRDGAELERAWLAAAEPVAAALDAGKAAAFITLGDPGVYSTWIYLRRAVLSLRPGTETVTVPGVMAANAAAARLGRALVEGDEALALLPLPDPVAALDPLLALVDTIAVYKIGSRLGELAAWAAERGLDDGADLVVGVGLERERAGRLAELAATAEGYLSVAVVSTRRKAARS